MPFIHCAVCFQLCRMHQSHEISNHPRKANYRAYLYISKQTEAQLRSLSPGGYFLQWPIREALLERATFVRCQV